MMIQVNENIDEYREDFYKGLTLRQTLFSGGAVAAGAAAFMFLHIVIGLPQSIALYAALPAVFPSAAAGFLKIHGMTLTQYLKARRNVREHPVYYFKPALIGMMEKEDGTYGHKNAGQDGGKKLKKKQQKKQKIIMISEVSLFLKATRQGAVKGHFVAKDVQPMKY